MTTPSNSTELNTNTIPTPKTDPGSGYAEPKVEPVVEPTPEPVVDDLGYDIEPSAEPKVETPEPKVEPEVEPEKVDPSTGYSKDQKIPEPKTPEADPAEPKVEPTDEAKTLEEINEALGDYGDKEIISKFAIDNKMTKEQVVAYVNLMKSEDAKTIAQEETARQELRSQWKKELMDDNSFGGDNFDINVDKVEKVLSNFMPNTKKVLTERGNMLPPYIMRDLLGISDAMNPTTSLISGDPSKPVKKEDGNFLDNMYE